jgi:hypothetical protein
MAKMIKNNKDKLISISVMGEVVTAIFASTPPGYIGTPYLVSYEGKPTLVPPAGGIVYNVRLGDPVLGWEGDHISPGASIKHKDDRSNNALNVYSCIGNEATVMSGEVKGARGIVSGKFGHGPHVLVYFEPDVLDKLAIGDRVQVKALGTGLEIEGYDDIKCWSLDPGLLEKMSLSVAEDGRLRVPVTAVVPGELIGAGSGHTGDRWDVDIMTSDKEMLAQHRLLNLRFGDIVAITDYDSSGACFYLSGAVTVGVVSQGDSYMAGHGPGVTPIMSSPSGKIEPVLDPKANIALLLDLRSDL